MGMVIYPPTIDWGYMRQRPQHVMSMFASHGFPVVYMNKTNHEGPVLQRMAPNLYVVNHYEFFMQAMFPHFSGEKKLYWSSWSRMLAAADRFQPSAVVYDCVDDFPDWEKDERQWIHRADFIVCTAEHLLEKMQAMAPGKPSYLVRNGCEWEHFASALSMHTPALPGLPPTNGFKIGYVGAWAPWVDEQLVKKVGAAFPNDQVAIVGPKLRDDADQLGPNVYNLGYRDYRELPAILSYLDVCIIPFRLNRVTKSTNPIKVYEYMAAGKPVVSTNLPEVRKLQPYVYVAEQPEEFISMIRLALHTPIEHRFGLSELAKAFSWGQRFAQIYAMLQEHRPELVAPLPDASVMLDALSGTYQSRFVPLIHGTVNSYYPELALAGDPPLIGKLPRGEYQIYLQFDPTAKLPPFEKAFLEFEVSGQHVAGMDAIVQVGISYAPWEREHLMDRNKPTSSLIATCKRSDYPNETISVEMTPYLHRGLPSSFHLSTPQAQLMGIHNAKLTLVGKW